MAKPRISLAPWENIRENFKEGIILGNGASIAIDPRFSYESLFINARENELITQSLNKIFCHLKTQDFELVLKMLWHAYHINQALEIGDSKTSAAYEELRNALIQSVRKFHVDYGSVVSKLLRIAGFLKGFQTVASLNYDFIVYWAMLVGNNSWGPNWFKDCFINDGKFEANWKRFREPCSPATGSTLVFYPHGNLIFATDIFGEERKIVTDESDSLLGTIVKKWETGEYTPLFVSEGTTEQKLHAIYRSSYLQNVFEIALRDLGTKVVILGWSFGDQDEHILRAVCANNPVNSFAVSVFKHNDWETRCLKIKDKIIKTIGNDEIEIIFFDVNSKGCWIN